MLGFSRVCVCVAHDLRVLEILSARTACIYRGCGDILRDLLCGDGNVRFGLVYGKPIRRGVPRHCSRNVCNARADDEEPFSSTYAPLGHARNADCDVVRAYASGRDKESARGDENARRGQHTQSEDIIQSFSRAVRHAACQHFRHARAVCRNARVRARKSALYHIQKRKPRDLRYSLCSRTYRGRGVGGRIMNAIELKQVNFSYDGKTKILENTDFTAEYGEVTLLSGHSGEGKSTLMYIVSGIIPNVNYGELTGEVKIAGEDIKGKKLGYVCRKVGVVLQNADEQIIQKIVEDEIAFGCENLAFPPEKIQKQINIVCNLLKLDKTWKCRTLSGGQKQRLITASTLAMGQKIIILDEPLANLDKDGAAMLMGTLRSLAKAGYCVVVIEHRLDMVLPFVDTVWHIGNKMVRKVENRQEYLIQQTAKIEDSCRICVGQSPIFTLKNVKFSVKDREILKDITLEIPKGGRTVFLGENGCGKTTLMRLIARLYKPTGGCITQYIDEKFKQKPRGSRAWFKKVGVVYQNPDYQLFMPTVEKEINFGAPSPEYAEHIAGLFGIKHLWHRHPQSLSEGQKRRVSIAAVVACAPEVLLLDEPTVGQDYDGLCQMVEILNKLHEQTGNTMITITHDVRCAEALCDQAYLIADGVVQRSGGKELVREYFTP